MKQRLKSPKKSAQNQKNEKTQKKDPIKQAKTAQQQKTIELINKERFEREWQLKVRGPSLANYEFTVITQALFKIMNKAKDMVHASRELSEMLVYELGFQHWNVIIVNGPFSRKTYSSGGYFVVFERADGTQAIIWLNKLVNHDQQRLTGTLCHTAQSKNLNISEMIDSLQNKRKDMVEIMMTLIKLYKDSIRINHQNSIQKHTKLIKY